MSKTPEKKELPTGKNTAHRRKVVLLDRDGVINIDRDNYILDISQFRFLPNTLEALKLLKESGFEVHIVSNQSPVGRELLTPDELQRITAYMLKEIEKAGGEIKSVNYCPHHPDEDCNCRKPETGLLQKVAGDHSLNLQDAWLIGDSLTDIEAGNRVGCRTILVEGGSHHDEAELKGILKPYLVVHDILAAVSHIIDSEDNDNR